jgi:hypothetical protein
MEDAAAARHTHPSRAHPVKTILPLHPMKTTTVRTFSLSLLAASLTAFGLTGCTQSERVDASAKTGEALADTKDALSQGWNDAKTFTFEKRDDFRANAKALTAKMDARMSELHANYSEARASASRKAAMAEIKASDAAYKEKLAALGTATADTWDSAKQNVISAWDRLQASYYKARAD